MDAAWNDELAGRLLNSRRYYGILEFNVCWSLFRNVCSGRLGFLRKRILMSEYDTIEDERVENAGSEIENFFDGMSDRLNEAVDGISDLADGVEELSDDIKSLLEDLRAVQSKTGQEKKDKLESLIDQLEGVSKDLQKTLWTMDFASEDLLENADL